MQARDYRKTTSGFIHGFRYNIESLFNILNQRYRSVRWPSTVLDKSPDALLERIVQRINCSSSLWQQFGFLGDVITINNDEHVEYSEDFPVDYAHESIERDDYFIVTLEFGKIKGDPFNIQRTPSEDNAERSTFLHPVIRRYNKNKQVAELHLLEDLAGEWKKEVHFRPLRKFIAQHL